MTDKEAKERHPQHRLLTGHKYGKLTMLEFLGMSTNEKKLGPLYRVKCDCGKILNDFNARGITITNNPTRSCGCNRKGPRKRIYTEATKKSCYTKFLYAVKERAGQGMASDSWDIETWFSKCSMPCYYCGKIDIRNFTRTNRWYKAFTEEELKKYDLKINGLDRADSSKGYLFSNSRPCCYRCNVMKSDQNEADFYAHVLAIANHLKSHA